MKKFKIWLLIILNFIVMFGTPIIAGYFIFANDISSHKGGAFFYFVILVTVVVFTKRISTAIKKMKASGTKAIFKLFMTLIVLYALYLLVTYIGFNFAELSKLILITMAGRIVSFVLELLILKIDREYVEEIGVL